MRKISSSEITSKVKELCIRAACELGSDVVLALEGFRGKEESPLGKEVLDRFYLNPESTRQNVKKYVKDLRSRKDESRIQRLIDKLKE